MSKEVLVFYYDTVWPTYVLDCGERWPMDDSLDYCTIMQLEQYCQQFHKWDEIYNVNAFLLLHNRISPEVEVHLMVQRREGTLKPLPDSTQEEKENEKIGLTHALNSRNTRFIAEGPPPLPFPL
ncbi:hypothetical protein HJG60_007915 [Phyllostomus discolor]|uniref:Uncharacterized protein n=1 Tax=Phyllostomus discolor TaxID=89673 RepID=A0A834BL88_9CHIR|nr:hypothetical protein HJG60_007915 [Phyllostomus discolor]